ncbi:sulfotransferase family protein [Kordiimonas aestuarii]|uniref:sulfotransferase family protein n=1 Tax=Kordiimonas aestuarii TaxID=1005925 RepID=UPI0021D0E649|nr:hypothetical protein [Kordiimonas aestuarii]
MKKRILFIVGPHRSGTSVVTHAFHQAGFDVGDTLLPANKGNPHGYWEDKVYVACNEEILTTTQRHWRDPRPIDIAELQENAALLPNRRLIGTRLAGQLETSDALVIKDPRLCRTLPLWLEALDDVRTNLPNLETGFVVVARNPHDTIMSLVRRDREEIDRAALLWLAYTLDAVVNVKGLNTHVLPYADFTKSPFKAVEAALTALGWSDAAKTAMRHRAAIDAVLKPTKRKAKPGGDDGISPAMQDTIDNLDKLLQTSPLPFADIDQIKRELEKSYTLFAPFIDAAIERSQRTAQHFETLSEQHALLKKQLKVAETRLRLKKAQEGLQ